MKKSPTISNPNPPRKSTSGNIPSPPSSAVATPPSSNPASSTQRWPTPVDGGFSRPHVVDLVSCNQRRFWKSVTRNFRRYLTCFKPAEPAPNGGGKRSAAENNGGRKLQKNCNYYSEMNDEERDEKLNSVISYCKDSTSR
ncbi:hypothetical protein U1Q18_028690, partial [Sarracenia purpurea var. burkii]